MTGALVPLQRVRFGGGYVGRRPTVVVEPLPRNTLDLRYPFCRDHRTACVCREAEHAEQLAEYRHELDAVRAAALEVLVGHRLFDWGGADDRDDDRRLVRGDGPLACQCTGCRLMRRADIPGLSWRVDEHGVIREQEA
jgi:hypothetical protein